MKTLNLAIILSLFSSVPAMAGTSDIYCKFSAGESPAYLHAFIFSGGDDGFVSVISKKRNLTLKGSFDHKGSEYRFHYKGDIISFNSDSQTVKGPKIKHVGKIDGICSPKYETEFGGQTIGPDGFGDEVFENAGEPS